MVVKSSLSCNALGCYDLQGRVWQKSVAHVVVDCEEFSSHSLVVCRKIRSEF